MNCATILPTHYLPLIEDRDYHMALAHLIGKDKAYTEFYKSQVDKKHFVILDNGVIETGKPLSIERVVAAAKEIGAHELILPDVFQDMEATLRNACEAIPYVKENLPDIRIMAVPQGKIYEEWIECAYHLIAMDINTLGIPKVLTKMAGRDGRLLALEELGHSLRGLDVHLLGCWETPIECTIITKAVENNKILPVRGVDSAIAYVYSREGMLICNGPRPSGEIHFNAKDADSELLQKNILIWEKSCTLSNIDDKVKNLWM